MRLTDTMVLVGALNPKDVFHKVAFGHLEAVRRGPDTFVPSMAAVEFDLVMKGRGYTSREREDALDWLANMIPSEKIVCNSVFSLREAAKLQEKGMGYFDSMISALALEKDAVVITRDKVISEAAKIIW